MTKQELIEKLDTLGVKPTWYSLDDRIIEGTNMERNFNYYGDNKKYEEWRVFEQERGNRWNEDIFYNEDEAYENIYQRFKISLKHNNKA
ncbi:MAG: hypothetical protein ABI367_15610 [Mucilaginibacter sp.]